MFAVLGRVVPASAVSALVAQLGRVEADAERHERHMTEHEAVHAELDRRILRLERELAAARAERLAVYMRWWRAREERNRARHVARRLRRRLARLRRRCRE